MILCVFVIIGWIAFSFWYQKRNAYIEKHKRKIKNDSDYKKYLDWCEKNNQIPMNKDIFIKEVEEKEKYINSITKL